MSRTAESRRRVNEIRRQLRRWRGDTQDWFDAFVSHLGTMRARRQFILTVGFHHSGTTLVQSVLRDQGVYVPVSSRRPAGYPPRPAEFGLRHIHKIIWQAEEAGLSRAMTKIPTVDMAVLKRTVFDIRWLAPSCLVVPYLRDPAAVALSLEGRLRGWQPGRARANAEMCHRVSTAWLVYASKRPDRCIPLSLEDFTAEPERHVRLILGLAPDERLPCSIARLPNPVHSKDDWLPDRRKHVERRHIQSNSPVYEVRRDDWMHNTEAGVLDVLLEIRRTYGTSPHFASQLRV